MIKIYKISLAATVVAALMLAAAALVFADSAVVDFESYTTGDINGQDGWSKTGAFDVEVTSSFGVPGFGAQSLRFSNAVTSGSFGDQTFAKPLADAAGESNAQDTSSGGVRQPHFEAEFEIRSLLLPQQPGLFLSVSPDRGDGARMSYLSFEDTPEGIDVTFFDTPGETNPATFAPTLVADNLSRAETHKVKFVIDFVEGSSNDIVEIYINDALVHTGTTWENYYRFDDESNPSLVNQSRVVKTLLFRAGGTAAPDTMGLGYLIDNVSLSSSGAVAPTESTTVVRHADLAEDLAGVIAEPTSWFFYNDENDTIDTSLGSFVTGPDTAPLGDGSAEINVTGTERRNLATYQFSGTPLSSIREMKFSTYNASATNPGSANRSAYLNFNIDFDGSDTWQRRLAFVPSQNDTVVQNSWQEWDAIDGGDALWWWSGYASNGNMWPDGGTTEYRTWNDLLESFPGIRVRVSDSWLGMRVGEPYADGYTENLDNFVFGTNTETKIFDFEPTAAAPDITVTIMKYIDGVHATDGNADSLSFPMESSWDADNIGPGSGSFALAPSTYEAETTEMSNGADYSTNEVLTETNVGASCADSKPFALVGYTVGTSELDAAGGTPTATAPALTNITEDMYVIVWNEDCDVAPTVGTLTLLKDVVNDDDGSNVDIDWTLEASGPTLISGAEGDASVTNAVVDPGTYDLSETGPAGYSASAWSCTGGNQTDDDTVEIAAGDTVICTITNNDEEVAPPPPLATACDTPTEAPAGYSLVLGTPGYDNVTLAPFTMFVGLGSADRVTGLADGNYIVCTGDGHDRITLGNGESVVSSGEGNDRIETGDGKMIILAGEGHDRIATGNGNDVIEAGNGFNKVESGAGDDHITTGSDNSNINGGAGFDTCVHGGAFDSVENCEA